MTRLLLFILLIFILYYLLRFLFKDKTSSGEKMNKKNEPEELVQDPYCQTYIPRGLALKKKVGGRALYFCCEKCLKSYIRGESKDSAKKD